MSAQFSSYKARVAKGFGIECNPIPNEQASTLTTESWKQASVIHGLIAYNTFNNACLDAFSFR